MSSQEQQDELVEPEDGCPNCGQREMDSLVWDSDGEVVHCVTCGFDYDPAGRE